MKLPIQWLRKYIDLNLSAEKLADRLTMTGTKVEEVIASTPEAVIDIEITSNRPDCLSILGLAREVSAITGKKVCIPKIYEKRESASPRAGKTVDVLVEDKKGCPRYTARVIRNVRVSASPSETQRLLQSAGTRAISNVVDATNFVLYECGQPMHAFDLDKLEGQRIIVRRSRKGEKFLGLDGIEHTLDDKTLIIADIAKPVALAGVMGGKLAEVTTDTKNILLESAYFDPVAVRQAVKKYKIVTESGYRFERAVDPENIDRASARCAELILDWAGGVQEGPLMDKNSMKKKPAKAITLRLPRMEMILGTKITQARTSAILRSLGFSPRSAGKDRLSVKTISSRRDVTQEIDLAEEVLRIEGFEKAPVSLPPTHHSYQPVHDPKAVGMMRLKRFLAASGLDEILTYSLLSEKKIKDAEAISRAHRLVNTLSAEQEFFRPTLLPGMLDAILFNAHRKATSLKFFEIGNRLSQGKEETVLSLGFYGAADESWLRKSELSFFDLKGLLGNVFDHLRLKNPDWVPSPTSSFLSSGAEVTVDGQSVGMAGEVSGIILKRWDIANPVYYAEIVIDDLFDPKAEHFRVRPVLRFPAVRRDIAFMIDQRVSVRDLESAMVHAGEPFLHQVQLFDQFSGKQVPQGKRSLAFSLSYQKEDGTFTDQEIQALQQKVGETLKRLYQAEFR